MWVLFCTFPHPAEINFWLRHCQHSTQRTSESFLGERITCIKRSTQTFIRTHISNCGRSSRGRNPSARVYSGL